MDNFSDQKNIKKWPTQTCLISKLTDQLSKTFQQDLSEVLIVLPTQRLSVILSAHLAQQNEALLAPDILTLDSFASQNIPKTHTLLKPASDLLQEALLADIIKSKEYKHLKVGHEHEIKQFFADIIESSIEQTAFEKLQETVLNDFYRAEEHASNLIERFHELKELFEHFVSTLSEKGLAPSSLIMKDKAKLLTNTLEAQPQTKYKHIYLVGFTTIKPYYQDLLHALLKESNVELWISSPPKLAGQANPIKDMLTSLKLGSQESNEQSDTDIKKFHNIHKVHSPLFEVTAAANLVEEYLQKGCPPSQIGVLLANEKSHGALLKTTFNERSISANMAITIPLKNTSTGSFLNLLKEFLTHDPDTTRLLHLITHPISLHWLKENLELLKEQSTLAIKSQLIQHICQSPYATDYIQLRTKLNQKASLQAINLFINKIDHLFPRNRPLTYTEWSEKFTHALDLFGIFSSKNLKETSKESIRNFFSQLSELDHFSQTKIKIREYFSFAIERLLSIDTREIGYPLKGIQVLNVIESRYVPFEVVIVLGMTEGNFPKALPNDYLVDDWLKTSIGLSGWKYIEALEDTTFHLLKERLSKLELFYSKEENGQIKTRSRFIESLLSQKQAQLYEPPITLAPKSSQKTTTMTVSLDLGNYKANRERFFHTTSATSLKSLITCPYSFLLKSLKVENLMLPKEQEAIVEGNQLHQVLETFFTSKINNKAITGPLSIPDNKEEQFSYCLNRLNKITELVFSSVNKNLSLNYHLKNYAWPKFSEHLIKTIHISESIDSETYKEFKLNPRSEKNRADIEIGSHKIAIKGSIDSIDRFRDHYILTDYKRKSSPSLKDIKNAIQPQLILYSMALEQLSDSQYALNMQDAIIGYWSILDGVWHERGVGESIQQYAIKNKLARKTTPTTTELKDQLLNTWKIRLDDLNDQKNNFSPDPSEKSWCQYCEHKNICRVNDPAYSEYILENAFLEKHLSKAGIKS